MLKVLETYHANPTLKNAKAVIAYGRKHPFSVCLLANDLLDLLVAAGNHANKGA